MPPHLGKQAAPDLMDADISFSLDRLFDHYNMDHIPEEDRLKSFKQRNLAHIKSYKAAVKIFGGPRSRRRVITAPPMETPLKHRLGVYHQQSTVPKSATLNSDLNPQKPPEKVPSAEEIENEKEKEKYDEYKKWITERKKLRKDLNNIGLNESWLNGKPNMTELERRVMTRIQKEKQKPQEDAKVDEPPPALKQPPPVPVMKIPSPMGLQILDEHLAKKRIRLLDLFRLVDKDKNWAVSKDEFAKCIKEAQLDITPKELEDLVISLDNDLNEEVDYGELAQGMEVWKRERRDNKRASMCSASSSPRSSGSPGSPGGRSQQSSKNSTYSPLPDEPRTRVQDFIQKAKAEAGRPSSNKSSNSSERSRTGSERSKGGKSTPRSLEPPPSDLRLEQMILSSEEAMVDLRKHDHVVLARTQGKRKSAGSKRTSSAKSRAPSAKSRAPSAVIKTGNKAIDNHSQASTLGGEVGEMVDKFRQMRLKEYYDVVRMCEQKGVPLTPHLLERVLLYPPDHASGSIKRRVSQPGAKGNLLSFRFATSPKPPRPPLEVRHKDKMKRSSSGQLLIDSRHIYPPSAQVAPSLSKETLSTGRALISRKIDCWMTFEEYNDLTGHLAVRYKQLHGNVDDNAFWPGHLLNKLRLYMPGLNDGTNAIFSNTRQTKRSNPGYHNDLNSWPVGPEGHVTFASCEPHYRQIY